MNKVETYNRKNILSQIKWLVKMVRYLLGKESSEGGGNGNIPDVSATERGVVNNTPLQELGGVDKMINGVRIGRGEGNYSSSVVLGRVALESNTTGNHNVAVGNQALRNNTSGSENTTLGANSGRDITTGSRNTLIGTWAGYTSKTASDNVSIGYAAGGREFEEPTGGRNVSLGATAAPYLSSGANNISIGFRSANALRTGNHNIMIGVQSGDKTNSTLPPAATWDFGDRNIFIGRLAGLWAVPNLAEDYLLIHSYHNQSGENKTPLILGHFTDRFLRVGGVLELDPQFLPIPDTTFTKKLVYNPTDGKVTAVDDTSGGIQSIVAGANISVDNTDPQNPVVSSTAESEFVQITEGANTGWGLKYRADNPNYYGNIGQNAIDLGYSQNNSTTIGATGTYSTVSGGLNNIASGDASTIPGGLNNFASGHFSTVSGGLSNTANSYGEWVGGLFGTIPTGQDGAAWVTTDRLFNIGNGITDDARSNAFTILKNGLATLPSVTNALIDAEPTGKAVITREWVEDAIDAIPTPNLTLEQARQNGNVLEGDVEMLLNTSLFVGEDSEQGATHYLRFIDDLDGNSISLGTKSNVITISGEGIGFGSIASNYNNPERNVGFYLIPGDDSTPLAQVILNMDASTKGLVGTNEFDKQGDRKAFAQIADVDDFYTTIPGYDAGETQTLKNINGVMTWVTD